MKLKYNVLTTFHPDIWSDSIASNTNKTKYKLKILIKIYPYEREKKIENFLTVKNLIRKQVEHVSCERK